MFVFASRHCRADALADAACAGGDCAAGLAAIIEHGQFIAQFIVEVPAGRPDSETRAG
jgi:hypothetical protein